MLFAPIVVLLFHSNLALFYLFWTLPANVAQKVVREDLPGSKPLLSEEYLEPESQCHLHHLLQAEPDTQQQPELLFLVMKLISFPPVACFREGLGVNEAWNIILAMHWYPHKSTLLMPALLRIQVALKWKLPRHTHIGQVNPGCMAWLSCRSWLAYSGAMGTQSMSKSRHLLSCKLQDILGFICTPRCTI